MRRSRLCLAALAALAIVPASAAAAAPRTFEVVARKGQEARAIAAVHRYGGRVTLRRGRTLQVRLPRARLSAVRQQRGRSRGGAGLGRLGRHDHLAGRLPHRRRRPAGPGPARRGREDRRARPRLRHALALEARHRAAAGERHRRGPELRSHDGRSRRSPGSRRPTRRRATASRSPRSCTTWRPTRR